MGYRPLQANCDCRCLLLNRLTELTTQQCVVHLYMNFLAHAYLSFNNAEMMVGNMVSDFVKGKARYTFSPAIQNGIELHRRIDYFTDTHSATKRAMQVFKPRYRLYSAVFVDIVYDHFLANDPLQFTDASLYAFTQNVYEVLYRFSEQLPSRFLQVLPYMKTENWLYNYRQTAAMHKSFKGVVRRSNFLTEADVAFDLFMEHYTFLQSCYENLFADIKVYAQQQFQQLVT